MPSPDETEPADQLGDYRSFLAKIGAHAERVEAAHAADIACASGCSGCCHRDLSVFPIEAAAIRQHLGERGIESLPPAPAPSLSPISLRLLDLDGAQPCAMLDGAGLCRIYAARPLICRTHGLPLAIPDDEGVYGDVCPLSFEQGTRLADIPATDFLSLETVNTVLAALNQRFVQETGAPPERVSLSVLAGLGQLDLA